MPRLPALDYEREYRNFLNAKAVLLERHKVQLTEADYADCLGIARQTFSTHFAEIKKREVTKRIEDTLRHVTIKALNKTVEGLNHLTMSETPEAVGMVAKVAYGAADRIGFSPQQVQINMQQNNQQNVVIPPLFAKEDEELIKPILEGKE